MGYLKGYLKRDLAVTGHRGVPGASTACPGNTYKDWLPYIADGAAPLPPPDPDPEPPPTVYDLARFMAANLSHHGPLYEVQTVGAGQERHQTQVGDGGIFYHTKNANWEELRVHDGYIWRGTDTSQSDTTYYTLRDGGKYWSKWAPRCMSVGQIFQRDPLVYEYRQSDCLEIARSGVKSWIRLDAVHLNWISPGNGEIQLPEVMQLSWLWPSPDTVEERFWYAPGYGLVGWKHRDGRVAGISEIHAAGARPDNVRLALPCLDRG